MTCKEGGLTEYPGPIKQKLMKLVLPLGLNRKEGIQQRSKHGGLSEEGFSKVGSDVCRATAVFFVLSCCSMRKHKALHETVVGDPVCTTLHIALDSQ